MGRSAFVVACVLTCWVALEGEAKLFGQAAAPGEAGGTPAAQQVPAPAAVPGGNASAVIQMPVLTGPLVAKPPEYARWVIRFELIPQDAGTDGKTAPVPMNPRTMEYMKGGKVGRSITTWKGGQQSIVWFYDRVVMEKYPVEAPIRIAEIPEEAGDPNAEGYVEQERFLKHYPGFEWLRRQHYVGQELKNGQMCLHFLQKVPTRRSRMKLTREEIADFDEREKEMAAEAQKAGGKEATVPTQRVARDEVEVTEGEITREAWVTVEGRWPIAIREGDILKTFQHLEPPVPGALPRMGPEFEALLADYCREWNLPPPKY